MARNQTKAQKQRREAASRSDEERRTLIARHADLTARYQAQFVNVPISPATRFIVMEAKVDALIQTLTESRAIDRVAFEVALYERLLDASMPSGG